MTLAIEMRTQRIKQNVNIETSVGKSDKIKRRGRAVAERRAHPRGKSKSHFPAVSINVLQIFYQLIVKCGAKKTQ